MTVLQNAAQILKLYNSECTELTVTDVATLLDIPKANASRLLKAMRESGLLETIGDSKRHRPGRMLLAIGAAFRGSSVLMTTAGEIVKQISTDCGHTGFVSVRDGDEVASALDFPGTNALRVVGAIGRRLPAHSSATGRSLLARLTDSEVHEILNGNITPVTEFSPTSVAQVFEKLNRIRRDGYAESLQETTLGVDAYAIAVGDPQTGETVSLCVVFPSAVVPEEERNNILNKLVDGAAEIARITGDPDFKRPVREKHSINGKSEHE